jgi:hypothetical protein
LPVDAARMNREAKLFLDGLCELRRGQRSIGCLDSADELHDLGSQLVAVARTTLFWKQPRQASPLKNMRWVECQLVAKLGLKTTFKGVVCAAAAWRKRSA